MKRVLSVLLSTCLLLGLVAGCTDKSGGGDGASTGEVPMGRYIEEQGETLDGVIQVYDFHRAADGSTVFYGRTMLDDQTGESVYKKYTVPAAGGPITAQEVPGLSEFSKTGIRSLSEGADGALYALSNDEKYRTMVGRSENGGPFEVISLSDADKPAASDGDTAVDGSVSPDADKPAASGGEVSAAGSISMGGVMGSGDSVSAAGGSADAGTESGTTGGGIEAAPSGGFFFGGESSFPSKIAMDIVALEDGGFIVAYGDKGASHYGADGTLLAEFLGNSFAANVIVTNGSLIIGSPDGVSLLSYDLSTGKQNGTYTYENMKMGVNIAADADNFYLADSTGVYRQAKGGTAWEKLVDGDLTSLVMPNLNLVGLAPDGSGGFAALLGSEEDTQFVRYLYSAETPTNPDTELSIFSLHDNSTIRQTIGEFQRRNPNVRVNFRVGLDEGGSATTEDVIRTLNTELLAGKGPDLILLDGMNLDSYIEKGVLLDLTDFVKGQSGLLSNLTNAYEKDGKIYGVPSRFTFPVMMGLASDVDSITSLQALVERVRKDQSGTPPFLRASNDLWSEDGVGIMMDYYDSYADSFLKENGSIDEEALTAFFAAMQELDKTMKEYTPQYTGGMLAMTVSTVRSGGFEPIDMGASDLKDGKALFHTQAMAGIFALDFISQNLSGLPDQKLAPLFGGSAYTPKGGVGINAAGKQQELAKSFLEMLLSPTVQDNYLYDGYPVNSASLDKLVEDTLNGSDGMSFGGNAGGAEGSTGEKNDMGFAEICGKLDTPLLSDQVIKDAVEAQSKGLMDGSVTPADAAAKVVEKTRIYLSE